jgi:predicted ArsR family transcriptional regulator
VARRKTRVAPRRARQAAAPSVSAATAPSAAPVVLEALKRSGALTIRELAALLHITYEAVRQQLRELTKAGWVTADPAALAAAPGRKRGPASRQYRLSAAAEHLFPKQYDELSVELVQRALEQFGGAGVVAMLARMTQARVARWAPRLRGLGVKEKLKALSALYGDRDAWMQVQWRDGAPALIERNCPFLNVAKAHPAICSVSVNTLSQLLGCKVVREQRFQAGHGRCVFRVRLDEPRPPGAAFALEP